ncbi:unnamed protein product [Blepharisma stoltei]|uniref:Uncharacterized protein n=1 Tax=Blepharisma stoltei TaxID=1481888 RepID=A0AAU9IN30_9CILI|nr:unnamed protein product [Blepharisma stoltei]
MFNYSSWEIGYEAWKSFPSRVRECFLANPNNFQRDTYVESWLSSFHFFPSENQKSIFKFSIKGNPADMQHGDKTFWIPDSHPRIHLQ